MNFFRILCVDDNPSLRWYLKIGLGLYGFEVVTASHGIDALMQYKAQAGDFGVIVTNHDRPNLNGLKFVRTVRKSGFKGRIVVSGRLKAKDLRIYQQHAVNDFFHQSFEINLLATMLLQSD